MATAYTSLLGLALPVTGELSGTWGDLVNQQITQLIEDAVAGTTTLNTDADVTLTTTTGASNQARAFILNCTGARTAARTITAPAASKAYIVINGTTGGYAVNLVGAGPTAGISVAAGEECIVAWNGSDFIKVATTLTNGTVTSASVVSANGFAGTVATATTTPAITLTTSITGMLKGNGTAISAGSAGTDYVSPTGSETLTNKTLSNPTVTNYVETVYAPGAGTAFTIDLANGTHQVFTSNGNLTLTLPSAAAGKSYTIDVVYGGAHTLTWAGGTNIRWPGGTTPTATSVNGKRDSFGFRCPDATNTHGSTIGQNYAA